MINRIQPSPQLLEIADAQAGCLSREQCLNHGLGPGVLKRLCGGGWCRTAAGVNCLREPVWMSWAWTGLLSCGPDSVLGAHASAYLDGVVDGQPERIVVWAPHAVSRVTPEQIKYRRGSRRSHGDPSRTWLEDSVLDLAWDCMTSDEVISIVGRVLSERLSTPARLLSSLSQRSRQKHRGIIHEMCSDLLGVESVLEERFVHGVAQPHGLPAPRRQVRRAPGRYDNLYEEYLLVVELDGDQAHRGEQLRDMRRDNRTLVDLGLVTLRYGWSDVVNRPCDVAAQIALVLNRGGWDGQLTKCRHCQDSSQFKLTAAGSR